MMTNLIARLALMGNVRVLDGGNCFDLYGLARALRRQAPASDFVLERVRIARAFTCYQTVTLLEETPASPAPTLILELLSTFRDENVSTAERKRLLKQCLPQLYRLSRHASLAISIPSKRSEQPEELLMMLKEAADQIWHFEQAAPPPQLKLL
jgi:hypothetical protein